MLSEDVVLVVFDNIHLKGFVVVVVVVLLFYVHGKHLRSCRNGQLTWAGLDLISG